MLSFVTEELAIVFRTATAMAEAHGGGGRGSWKAYPHFCLLIVATNSEPQRVLVFPLSPKRNV
jgi:hypothetical protein